MMQAGSFAQTSPDQAPGNDPIPVEVPQPEPTPAPDPIPHQTPGGVYRLIMMRALQRRHLHGR
jgi:hypothetical protein